MKMALALICPQCKSIISTAFFPPRASTTMLAFCRKCGKEVNATIISIDKSGKKKKWSPEQVEPTEREAEEAEIVTSVIPGIRAFTIIGNTREFLKFLVLRAAGQMIAALYLGATLQPGSEAYGVIVGSFILFGIIHVVYRMRPSTPIALLFALPIAAVELIQIALNPLLFVIDVVAAVVSILTISERHSG